MRLRKVGPILTICSRVEGSCALVPQLVGANSRFAYDMELSDRYRLKATARILIRNLDKNQYAPMAMSLNT